MKQMCLKRQFKASDTQCIELFRIACNFQRTVLLQAGTNMHISTVTIPRVFDGVLNGTSWPIEKSLFGVLP